MWTKAIDIYSVQLIRTKSEIFLGVGALGRLHEIAEKWKEKGIGRILVLAGKHSFYKSGASEEVMESLKEESLTGIVYELPEGKNTDLLLDEAAAAGRRSQVQAVLAVGGGRIADAGKCIALLLAQKEGVVTADLLENTFLPEKILPLAVINTSHGSGSENNPFAIVSFPAKKELHLISSDLFYPQYVICDPVLTVTLPRHPTRYSAMDAVNHAVESVVDKENNPMSIFLAHEIIKLVSRYLPVVEKDPGDLTGRYFLLFASLLAGLASDNRKEHFSHVLLHALHTLKPDLPHGLGVSVLMPSVVKKVYPEHGKVLAAVLSPIVSDLSGNAEEAEDAANGVESWISGCGVKLDLADALFLKENIDEFVEVSYQNTSLSLLLTVSPLESSRDAVRSIFDDALTPERSFQKSQKV